MLTAASLALASGADIWHAAFIGSIAAGIQVIFDWQQIRYLQRILLEAAVYMRVLILAAGLGTRLRPLTNTGTKMFG